MKTNKTTQDLKQVKKVIKEKKKLPEVLPYIPQKVEKYKAIKSMWTWEAVTSLWKHQRRFNKRFFVIMHQSNGMINTQYVYIVGDLFEYQGGAYVVNQDYMKWSDSLQCFVGTYTQGCALPLNLDLDEFGTIEDIKSGLKSSRVEMNVHPAILLGTIKTEVIQKLMRGEELEKLMRNLFLMAVFTLVGIVGIFVFLFNAFK